MEWKGPYLAQLLPVQLALIPGVGLIAHLANVGRGRLPAITLQLSISARTLHVILGDMGMRFSSLSIQAF